MKQNSTSRQSPISINFVFKLSAIVFILLFFSGCETVPTSTGPDLVQRMKRVAIVSTVGDVFTRVYIGVTVFGNEHEARKVPEWRIDRIYEEQLAATLRKIPGMTVIDATYRADAFSSVNGKKASEWHAIREAINTHCAANALDGVFVVTKGYGSFGMLAQAARGGERRGAFLELNAGLALLDCKSSTPVAVRSLFKGKNEKGYVLFPRMPYPGSWPWHGKWEPSVYDEVRATFVRLAAESWEPTVAAIMTSTKSIAE